QENLVWLEDLADTYQSLGTGKRKVFFIEHALQLRTLISGDRHPKIADSLRPLTFEYERSRQFEKAQKVGARLVKADQLALGHDSIIVANELFMLAGIEYKLKHLDRAESYARQALSIYL